MARADSALAKLPPLARVGIGAGLVVLIAVAYLVVFYGDIESSIKAAQTKEQKLYAELAEARQNEFNYQKDLAELSDDTARLRAALSQLPDDQSRAIVLSGLLGYTAREVGEVEGIPLGTAKTRIRTALIRLRAALVEEPAE